ncbi:hypothetical protein HJB56_12065 [Rhizobium lentis]|uniref:Uncharacterized protein n=1 Tax=Rhizobium lentis TaxID=1138194 RepID=A0A9Q3R0J0_9HYPH|nr:hypothetical protein [Rhizobium lentis]MBX4957427.1 hypothetical protein [Rhizobium lentis]MBX4974151.1 hypothetical protein [Rhizobium lentis]MBX4987417.1 hypothetical protein [Rhizobium lentis]MBX5000260.1 hypothetical protein [Rhizobium lentis]MBX5005862.1 hypothetical protein [Rhizobium lentis]
MIQIGNVHAGAAIISAAGAGLIEAVYRSVISWGINLSVLPDVSKSTSPSWLLFFAETVLQDRMP